MLELDLQKGLTHTVFGEDRAKLGEYGDSLQVRKRDGQYYLNFPKYRGWDVVRISQNRQNLNITGLRAPRADKAKLREKALEHQLQKLNYESNRGTTFLAKANNYGMRTLYSDDYFSTSLTWHRIKRKKNNWLFVIPALMLFLLLLARIMIRKSSLDKNNHHEAHHRHHLHGPWSTFHFFL